MINHIYNLRKIGCLSIFLLFSSIAWAQSGFKLKVDGEVEQPLALSLSDLAKMERKDAIMKDKAGNSHTFNGVPLAAILARAGVPSGKALHGSENLSKYVLVKCADGYQVLFALAELDSSVQDKNVIIADLIDGKPLLKEKGPLRIVAEGEKKTARSSYQVTSLIIGSIKK